jgi:hypothetical protein
MLFAIAENYRGDDPTSGVKPVKLIVKSKGHMTWGDEQIAAYRARHPLGTTARLAIELLLKWLLGEGTPTLSEFSISKPGKLLGGRARPHGPRQGYFRFAFCRNCRPH